MVVKDAAFKTGIREQVWGSGAKVTEKIKKVKSDIDLFIISLGEWNPDIVAKFITK